MLLDIRYCQGYGWHCGRLLLWLVLLLIGIPMAFIAVFAEEAVRVATHLLLPFALLLPFSFAFLAFRRLRRKFQGQPFAVCLPAFFMDNMTTLLIPRGHRHFRALVMLELFIWGSVVVAQLAILGVFYQQRLVRSDKSVPRKASYYQHLQPTQR